MPWQWSYPLALRRRLEESFRDCDNFSLLHDKFTPVANYDGTWGIGEQNRGKAAWLDQLVESSQRSWPRAAQSASLKRWLALVEQYQHGENRQHFVLRTAQPLIVGLGSEHVHETGLTLNPLTGAPMIPGSSLKGLARTYALSELVATIGITEWLPDEPLLKPLDDLLMEPELNLPKLASLTASPITETIREAAMRFRRTFGTVGQAGCAIFFDGNHVSEKAPRFSVDIMNPHYGKYYGSAEAPADDDSPIPVPYLTVGRGQEFVFAVVARHAADADFVRKFARTWLIRGLMELGAGAKGSQGYGLFRE